MQENTGPRRGPTKTSNPERRAYLVLSCAKWGLPSRSVVSHETDQDPERDGNWTWAWDVRPLRGRGFLWGRLSPGSLAPSAQRSPGAIHVRPLRGQLSAEPLSARLSGALPDMAKGLLLPPRGGFANLRCAHGQVWRTIVQIHQYTKELILLGEEREPDFKSFLQPKQDLLC